MKRIKWVLAALVLLILLILTFSLIWGVANFGNIGFDGIVFTLNMPLQGTDQKFIRGYLLKALLPALVIFAAIVALVVFIRSRRRKSAETGDSPAPGKFRRLALSLGCVLVFVGWTALLLARADAHFGLFNYIQSITDSSQLIEEEYVSPDQVRITFPEKKRNLIYIYMESAETTNQNVASGGAMKKNYVPEMTALAQENISFSQSDLIEGASVAPLCGWTMAGIVAETAGLPLKLYTTQGGQGGVDNSMKKYASFLPGAVTLGDILKSEGYRNVFMAGSDFVFGGRKLYCTEHGDYTILDYKKAKKEGIIPKDYKGGWGFEDLVLYDWAKEELTELAKSDEPFNFTMLTVDTHHPDGYYCKLCQDQFSKKYANVWACASRQISAFVDWIREQDFYENTTIVIAGDHCSMASGFYKDMKYHKYSGEIDRKVYNVFINSAVEPVNEKNRLFSTMDMFPSTLAAMGVQIEGERLGLGVNLFSEEPTLCERYGYESFFAEMMKKSLFYDQELLYP